MLLARQEHEDKRKRSKIEWKAAREGYHEAVLDLKNTEAKYRHYQGTILREHSRALKIFGTIKVFVKHFLNILTFLLQMG